MNVLKANQGKNTIIVQKDKNEEEIREISRIENDIKSLTVTYKTGNTLQKQQKII